MATCEAKAARCVCDKEAGHVEAGDPAHHCGEKRCGGSWTGTYGGEDFGVLVFPGGEVGNVLGVLGVLGLIDVGQRQQED